MYDTYDPIMFEKLDSMFAPDVRIIVKGKQSKIIACEALTITGANYLLKNSIIDKSYDTIPVSDGICFEVLD